MALGAFKIVAPDTLGKVLKWEQGEAVGYSRESVTVLAGSGSARELKVGQVLGKRLFGSPVITPDGGNTGNGALGTLTLGDLVELGDYVATCIAAAANAGTFEVVTPSGLTLGQVTVGVSFTSPHLNFAITDGGTDWVVGDKITVTVAAGDGKVTAVDFSLKDGSQKSYGVLTSDVSAPDGVDAAGVAVVREAAVSEDALVWPSGATADQKAAGIAELKAAGIITLQTA